MKINKFILKTTKTKKTIPISLLGQSLICPDWSISQDGRVHTAVFNMDNQQGPIE